MIHYHLQPGIPFRLIPPLSSVVSRPNTPFLWALQREKTIILSLHSLTQSVLLASGGTPLIEQLLPRKALNIRLDLLMSVHVLASYNINKPILHVGSRSEWLDQALT